jgi:cysteine synthase B
MARPVIYNPRFAAGSESESILSRIGGTPLLRLARIDADLPGVSIYAKAEWLNPGGSVKDRPALRMVQAALRDGRLQPGKTILDATSGNTGIAYAMIGAVLNHEVCLAIPANASPERRRHLQALGARLELTDPALGTDGAIARAREMATAEPDRYVYLDQYANDENWRAHYDTTAEEIWEQTAGCVSHFVAALGTGGSFVGTARGLRGIGAEVESISVQPDSPFHGMEGMKHMASALTPPIYDPTLADDDVAVSTEDAYRAVKRLAHEEGLFVGVSSGAALAGCLDVARRLPAGRSAMIVTIFPDSGARYVSERFWDEAEYDAEA